MYHWRHVQRQDTDRIPVTMAHLPFKAPPCKQVYTPVNTLHAGLHANADNEEERGQRTCLFHVCALTGFACILAGSLASHGGDACTTGTS